MCSLNLSHRPTGIFIQSDVPGKLGLKCSTNVTLDIVQRGTTWHNVSFICVFVCIYRALQNSLVYTISVISVFVSYTYVCYVLVYFVLYVYNCMHKRTIKYLVYLVSCDTA